MVLPEDRMRVDAHLNLLIDVAGTAVRESRGAVVAVLVLAIWLGLATLTYSNSPGPLLHLSLLASFLLFASAWSLLQKRAT